MHVYYLVKGNIVATDEKFIVKFPVTDGEINESGGIGLFCEVVDAFGSPKFPLGMIVYEENILEQFDMYETVEEFRAEHAEYFV